MSSRKPSKNGKLSLLDTAENKRQDSAGRGKISEVGFSTSDAAGSTSSLPAPPQWEAPKHGLPRIAQLDKAKKEGAKYREQKEKERDDFASKFSSLMDSRFLCTVSVQLFRLDVIFVLSQAIFYGNKNGLNTLILLGIHAFKPFFFS